MVVALWLLFPIYPAACPTASRAKKPRGMLRTRLPRGLRRLRAWAVRFPRLPPILCWQRNKYPVTNARLSIVVESAAPRWHDILEHVEALPCRLNGFTGLFWRVDRMLFQFQLSRHGRASTCSRMS